MKDSSPDSATDTVAHWREQLTRLQHQQQHLLSELRNNQQQFRELARSVWRVQEDERRKLARDIHDGLGQKLTALKHGLQRLPEQFDLPEPLHKKVSAHIELTAEVLHDTRKLSRLLRPPILDDLGLIPTLQWLVRSMSEDCDVDIQILIDDDLPALPSEFATLIYRISQEALTNIVKHANASTASLMLTHKGTAIRLVIDDDGIGFDTGAAVASTDSGFGLHAMQERASLFGGNVTIESTPGEGTRLKLEFTQSADYAN